MRIVSLFLAGFGLVISVYVHRDIPIPRRPGGPVS